MTEQEINNLIDKKIQEAAQKAQYGVTRVPVHTHNGIDSSNLNPLCINGMVALPGIGEGVLSLSQGATVYGPPTNGGIVDPPQIAIFPIPIISAGGAISSFPGGDAPVGSMILFDTANMTTTALWIKSFSGQSYTLTGSLSTGATSATLVSNWTQPSTHQLVLFSNGNQRTVSFTNGSAAITWSGGLSSNATSTILTTGWWGFTPSGTA